MQMRDHGNDNYLASLDLSIQMRQELAGLKGFGDVTDVPRRVRLGATSAHCDSCQVRTVFEFFTDGIEVPASDHVVRAFCNQQLNMMGHPVTDGIGVTMQTCGAEMSQVRAAVIAKRTWPAS